MRAIGYLLFDPETPVDSPSSRESQQQEIILFCQHGGHTLGTVFTEPSGTSEDRPALRQMFLHLQEQPDEFLVVVTSPAHLGSTPEEAVDAVVAVDGLGSRVVCTVEGLPDPLQGLLRILTTTGPGAERRQRIREAMQAKALQGEGLGKPPYGYRIGKGGKLEEVPQEAELVRLLFRLYLEDGTGVRGIARYLNERGYHTRRSGNWSMVTLRDMLRNRAYIGTYQRFGLRVPGSHPPLVPPETFRRAQDLMQSRSPRRHGGEVQPFLLSGLAYCAQCGNRMSGVTRRQTWRRKDGQRMRGVYRYYQCQSRTNQSMCRYHTWRAADLEETVADQLHQQLEHPTSQPAGQLVPVHRATAVTREEAQGRNRRRYLKYLQQAANGAISLRRLRFLLGELAATTAEQGWSGDPGPTASGLDDASVVQAVLDTAQWDGLDYRARRQLLQRWIERIDVGDEEAEVRLRRDVAA